VPEGMPKIKFYTLLQGSYFTKGYVFRAVLFSKNLTRSQM